MTDQSAAKIFNVWQLFSDDEHTATDGAYVRAMKARKWILISSAFLALVSLGAFKAQNFEALIRIFSFPQSHIFHVVLIGTTYLYVQYLFLLIQLMTVYASLLRERLFKSQLDNVAKATDDHYQAQSDLQAVAWVLGQMSTEAVGREAHEKSERDLQRALAKASFKLDVLEATDPRRNQTFTVMEVAIDSLRLLPPLIFGAAALYAALSSPLGLKFWNEMSAIGLPVSSAQVR